MILNHLIAISLVIISAGSLAEIYIKSENSNKLQSKQFKELTYKKLNNFNKNKGFSTFMGITFTLLFSSFFVLYLKVSHYRYNELVNRKETYLCFSHYHQALENYISNNSRINLGFLALNITSATVVLSPEAETTRRSLLVLQKLIHLSFLKKISSIPECTIAQKSTFMLNLPYQTISGLMLKNDIDGSSIIRANKWNLKIVKNNLKIRNSSFFYLKVNYKLKNKYQGFIQSNLKEIRSMDLPFLNPSFGSALSSLSL
jgi:hypothetical protein